MDFTLSEYNNNYSAVSDYEEENTQEIEKVDGKIHHALIPNSHPRAEKYFQMEGEFRSLLEISLVYRHIFSEYKSFNLVQSKVMDDVLYTDRSIILCAPTGSGKTVIFELAIIQLLYSLEDTCSIENFKIIYMAPIKALCSEKYLDWYRKFNSLGIKCLELTGDSDINDIKDLISYQIILTTPEKWDSLTRRWRDCQEFVASIKLFLIDEIHLLNEDRRGPILEAVVSRMKTIDDYNTNTVRFIGVSATIPNIEDVAMWLSGKEPSKYFQMPEEMRPVKLQKYVLGYNSQVGFSNFKFDMSLNYKLSMIIHKYSNGKPTLIFCSTRKSTEMASNILKNDLRLMLSVEQQQKLKILESKLKESKLRSLINFGITYHHAGLISDDRNLLEENFRKGVIPVLLCTSTLAMGVNLPAHLVIIKSTQQYIRGANEEYPENTILQMIGRAGRPQFDVTGIAVIMTQNYNVEKYEKLVKGTLPVESHLHKHLAEHLNSEIVLNTINDLPIAMKWLRSTFLYVRAIKNPVNYGMQLGMTKEEIEKKLEEMCLININALEKYELIIKDQNYGITIAATTYGRLMARYYLTFQTMKLFRQIKGTERLLDILNILINCHEFLEYPLRTSEKKILNDMNKTLFNNNNNNLKNNIRFPMRGKINTISMKISCLIQSILGNLNIQDPSLHYEGVKVVQLAERFTKCMHEYIRASEKTYKNGCFQALLNTIILSKCLKVKLWEDSPYVCKQIKKIGTTLSTLLMNAGKTSFNSLLETNPRELENIINKAPPFGSNMLAEISKYPRYTLTVIIQNKYNGYVLIKQVNTNYVYNNADTYDGAFIIIGDSSNNLLLCNDNVQFIITQSGYYEKTFKILKHDVVHLTAYLIHKNIVGLDLKVIVRIDGININENNEIKVHTDEPIKVQENFIINKNPKSLMDYYNTESTSNKKIIIEDEIFKSPAISPVKKLLPDKRDIYTNLKAFQCPSKPKLRKLYQSNDDNSKQYCSSFNNDYFIKTQKLDFDKYFQKINKVLDIGIDNFLDTHDPEIYNNCKCIIPNLSEYSKKIYKQNDLNEDLQLEKSFKILSDAYDHFDVNNKIEINQINDYSDDDTDESSKDSFIVLKNVLVHEDDTLIIANEGTENITIEKNNTNNLVKKINSFDEKVFKENYQNNNEIKRSLITSKSLIKKQEEDTDREYFLKNYKDVSISCIDMDEDFLPNPKKRPKPKRQTNISDFVLYNDNEKIAEKLKDTDLDTIELLNTLSPISYSPLSNYTNSNEISDTISTDNTFAMSSLNETISPFFEYKNNSIDTPILLSTPKITSISSIFRQNNKCINEQSKVSLIKPFNKKLTIKRLEPLRNKSIFTKFSFDTDFTDEREKQVEICRKKFYEQNNNKKQYSEKEYLKDLVYLKMADLPIKENSIDKNNRSSSSNSGSKKSIFNLKENFCNEINFSLFGEQETSKKKLNNFFDDTQQRNKIDCKNFNFINSGANTVQQSLSTDNLSSLNVNNTDDDFMLNISFMMMEERRKKTKKSCYFNLSDI